MSQPKKELINWMIWKEKNTHIHILRLDDIAVVTFLVQIKKNTKECIPNGLKLKVFQTD